MKNNKDCKKCGHELKDFTASNTINGGVTFFLEHAKQAYLGVCRNEGCVFEGIIVLSNEIPTLLSEKPVLL